MFDMTCCFLARKVKLERYKQRMSSKFWHARSGTLTCDWCGWLVTILWARSHPIIDLCGNKKNVFHEDRLNPNSILMSHANFEELQIYWMCQKLGLLNKSLIKLFLQIVRRHNERIYKFCIFNISLLLAIRSVIKSKYYFCYHCYKKYKNWHETNAEQLPKLPKIDF